MQYLSPATAFCQCLLLALIAGCSTNPVTGRDQIVAVPAAQAHAEIGYALANGAKRMTVERACPECRDGDRQAFFAEQVKRLSEELETAARGLSPDAFARIEAFQVVVDPALGIATGSSARGRVALGAGLAELEAEDAVIAFLIAREMAHVIARHDEEDSGARIFSSALTTLVPGFSLIVRFFASALGSGALMSTWAADQRREADDIAVALLERSGRSTADVAKSLAGGLRKDRLAQGEWAARYSESAARVALLAELPPRYADFGD